MIRKKKGDKWTNVPNSVIENKELSLKAIGLLTYLFKLPEDWVLYQGELVHHFKDGLDSIRSAFKELQQNGYLAKVTTKNKSGHFVDTSWLVTSEPFNFPSLEEPILEKPKREKPKSEEPKWENPQLQRTNTTKDLNNKELSEKVKFELFWDLYDKKVGGRLKCKKKWDNLSELIQLQALTHIKEYVLHTPDKKFRANPETYLNQQRWENEIIKYSVNGKESKTDQMARLREGLGKAFAERYIAENNIG